MTKMVQTTAPPFRKQLPHRFYRPQPRNKAARLRGPPSDAGTEIDLVTANAVPRILRGLAHVAPTFLGRALGLVPAALEIRLDVLELPVLVLRASGALPAVPVSRLVRVVLPAGRVVRARVVVLAPVRVFDRGIQSLGHGV